MKAAAQSSLRKQFQTLKRAGIILYPKLIQILPMFANFEASAWLSALHIFHTSPSIVEVIGQLIWTEVSARQCRHSTIQDVRPFEVKPLACCSTTEQLDVLRNVQSVFTPTHTHTPSPCPICWLQNSTMTFTHIRIVTMSLRKIPNGKYGSPMFLKQLVTGEVHSDILMT